MSKPEFISFLVNDRSSAFLHLIDACKFTESELVDLYMGVCYRLKDLIDLSDTPIHDAVTKVKHDLVAAEGGIEGSNEYLKELRDDY